jgi:putative FmdB family regulatory protein
VNACSLIALRRLPVPIYEYECTKCQKRFEHQQKMTDPSIQTCDQLGCEEAKPVNKIISAPAIMFKGTGWYVTDYSEKLKDPGAKPEDKGEKTEVKSSTSQTDGNSTSETKPSSDGASIKSSSESSSSSSTTTSPNSSGSPSPSNSSTPSSSGSSASGSSASSSSSS